MRLRDYKRKHNKKAKNQPKSDINRKKRYNDVLHCAQASVRDHCVQFSKRDWTQIKGLLLHNKHPLNLLVPKTMFRHHPWHTPLEKEINCRKTVTHRHPVMFASQKLRLLINLFTALLLMRVKNTLCRFRSSLHSKKPTAIKTVYRLGVQ